MKTILIAFSVVAVVILGGLYIKNNFYPNSLSDENSIVCPADTRQCPEGSYVSRTGPNCEFSACPEHNSGTMKDTQDGAQEMMMEKKADQMGEEKGMMDAPVVLDEEVQFSGKKLIDTNGSDILEYTKADYDKAVSAGKLVVLYFYANWCPLCRAEYPLMEKAFLSPLSGGVVGFRVNYKDNETSSEEEDIARAFGIAYQHTKVFIKNGNRVLKDGTTWDESRYISEVNKFLK